MVGGGLCPPGPPPPPPLSYMITGIVIRGREYPHKVPTANMELDEPFEPGIFTAMVKLAYTKGDQVLGQAIVWSIPGSSVLEVYIGQYEGDLYGEELTLFQFRQLERPVLRLLVDQAIRSVPLAG